MPRKSTELWLSFAAIILITIIYLLVVVITGSVPEASAFFGHSLGVIGFILMLMTEILYSLRKRSKSARWGRMSWWLGFHIFTGLVGPYMVLLHTAWRFNGLAGILMLLTVIIVASGFFGRYIYTAVPRSVDGIALEAGQLEMMIGEVDAQIRSLTDTQPGLRASLESAVVESSGEGSFSLILGRVFSDWRYQRKLRKYQQQMKVYKRSQVKKLNQLMKRRQTLNRQVSSLATARRLLSIWHVVHIPIGVALFTVAFIHIGAALYYATFLK